jgi:hypothetical protein
MDPYIVTDHEPYSASVEHTTFSDSSSSRHTMSTLQSDQVEGESHRFLFIQTRIGVHLTSL